MRMTDIDTVLWIAGFLGEALCLLVFTFRRTFRTFPVFYIWMATNVAMEPTFYWLAHHVSSLTYYRVYFATDLPQSLLEIGIIIEIAAAVLQPVKRSLPKKLPVFLVAALLLVGVGAFFFATHLNSSTLAHPRGFQVFDTTMAVLRLATFVLIAAFSQVLGVGWKNHILQLASGLGFYAAVSLIVSIAQSHLRGGPDYASQYFGLDHLRIASYLCALYYWCFCFVRKEAARKEFSPKMEEFLVSMVSHTKRHHPYVARSADK
ncbi:hypothetical protein [Silvibacterium acidisoli]|uniref:hypothetical protein n=1 Tax=Acidobacteriaceae bacterium ZG23-2 TaxID=2883246 RepID=UPI00406CB761